MQEKRVGLKSAAQVSLEYLLLTILLLGFIAILGGASFIIFSDSFSTSQIQSSLRVLQTAVNHVHGLGPGNAVVVPISLPSAVIDSNVGGLSGTELVLVASAIGGGQDFFVWTDSNVIGHLPKNQGSFLIHVSADENWVSVQDING